MTEEQKKLIEDNINLVYKFCHSKGLKDEDDIAEMVLFLCEHINSYDPSRGAFSTFCYTWLRSGYSKIMNYKYSLMRSPKVFTEIHRINSYDDSEIDILDENSELQYIDNNIDLEKFINSLDDNYRFVVEMTLLGYTQKEIADMRGTTRQSINQLLQYIQLKYREELKCLTDGMTK